MGEGGSVRLSAVVGALHRIRPWQWFKRRKRVHDLLFAGEIRIVCTLVHNLLLLAFVGLNFVVSKTTTVFILFSTVLTFVRFLAGMDSFVSRKVVTSRKPFLTVITFVRFLGVMGAFVSRK